MALVPALGPLLVPGLALLVPAMALVPALGLGLGSSMLGGRGTGAIMLCLPAG
jgi:hypothetical protein